MNLSAENIRAIRELVRSGYPLKARDAKDLLGHNDHLVELLEARSRLMLGVEIERDQLLAEIAGLKTGYEAYERVNAELKAENDALRNALAECINSLKGEMLQKFGGLLPEDMHPVTRREYDRDVAELYGYRAALGKGDQS